MLVSMLSASAGVGESLLGFDVHLHTKPLHATQLVADYTTMIRGCKDLIAQKAYVKSTNDARWRAIVGLT
jgi:hypothetical protein